MTNLSPKPSAAVAPRWTRDQIRAARVGVHLDTVCDLGSQPQLVPMMIVARFGQRGQVAQAWPGPKLTAAFETVLLLAAGALPKPATVAVVTTPPWPPSSPSSPARARRRQRRPPRRSRKASAPETGLQPRLEVGTTTGCGVSTTPQPLVYPGPAPTRPSE